MGYTSERYGLENSNPYGRDYSICNVGEEDDFKDAWSDGDRPNEYLDWVKEKRDLTEIKEVM